MAEATTERIRTGTKERRWPEPKRKPSPQRPKPQRQARSADSAPHYSVALIVVIGVLMAAGLGAGAYFLGVSTGTDVSAAREAGAQAGRQQGLAAGTQAGHADGFAQGRDPAYSAAYDSAYKAAFRASYEDAGVSPPPDDQIAVPGQ